MAVERTLGALTDELVSSLTSLSSESDASSFNALRSRAVRQVRIQAFARTNQFEVAETLAGLVEKFHIIGRDEVAVALQERIDELNTIRNDNIPELLSLLLLLSDQQSSESRVNEETGNIIEPPPRLTWADIVADDPLDNSNGIWQTVDFAVDDSGDEDVIVEEPKRKEKPEEPTEDADSCLADNDVLFFKSVPDNGLEKLRQSQFWQPEYQSGKIPQAKGFLSPKHVVITELQAIREVLFMFRGLTGNLFQFDATGEALIDKSFTIGHVSPESLFSVLDDFARIGSSVNRVRIWCQKPQVRKPLCGFQAEVEKRLHLFELFLGDIESSTLLKKGEFVVSLLNLERQLRDKAKPILALSDLLGRLDQDTKDSYYYLVLLFASACSHQALGEDEIFLYMKELFIQTFNIYLRPIQDWMISGVIDPRDDSFFVTENEVEAGLSAFWLKRYKLKMTETGNVDAPSFLLPFVQKILVTGKSVQFLKSLDVDFTNFVEDEADCRHFEVWSDFSQALVPFSESLIEALDNWISKLHSLASCALREQLLTSCGLWQSLDALETIFFCKNGAVFSVIDASLFNNMDIGRQSWKDRFLLTELFQGALSTIPSIDPERLVVRTISSAQMSTKSVNFLSIICVDYTLPWPLANILPKSLLSTYQSIFTFLFQLRRARHVLQWDRLLLTPSTSAVNWQAAYSLRYSLLWFVNTIYTYLTSLVFLPSEVQIRDAIKDAEDIDAMIVAFNKYGIKLRNKCILTEQLMPIWKAILAVLDLCILFGDKVGKEDKIREVKKSPAKEIRKKRRASRRVSSFKASLLITSSPSSSEDENDDEEAPPSFSDIAFDNSNNSNMNTHTSFATMSSQFQQLCGFIHDGLRGVARAGGEPCWDALADMLGWRNEEDI